MSLQDIVDVSISANTASPSRAGFGTPGLIAYFPTTVFPGRSRTYNSLPAMISDGFLASDPAYLMAVALKAQNPSVASWKILRKALPSLQTVKITPTVTTAGEVLTLTVEGTEVSYTILAGATVASICTALTTLFAAIQGVTATDNTTHVTLTPKNILSCTLTIVADDSKVFTLTIDGTAFAYSSDTDATATEIRDGLQALVIAGGYTAAEFVDLSADGLTITYASHAGHDTRVSCTGGSMTLASEVNAKRLLSVGGAGTGITVQDETPDPGIATDWANIIAEDVDFYGVGLDSESEAQIKALAALVETQRMIFVASSIDTQNKDASVTTCVMSDLKASGYARTAIIQAEYNSQYAGLRWLGVALPKDPGSITWAYKTLRGLTVSTLTAAQETALNGKYGNHYTSVGGVSVTQKGYSCSGEFLDITHGIDWFQARLQERIYGLLVQLPKIPYDVAGNLIYGEIFAQLEEARKKLIVAPNEEDTPWVITIPAVADISTADKALRNFPDVEFSAYLAGAVHTIQITGTLSL